MSYLREETMNSDERENFADLRKAVDRRIAALQRERADLSVEMTLELQRSIGWPLEEGCSEESEQPD